MRSVDVEKNGLYDFGIKIARRNRFIHLAFAE